MAIKSTYSNGIKKEESFPKLMSFRNRDNELTVILASGVNYISDNKYYKGIILLTQSNCNEVGFYSELWSLEFNDYEGSINLENKR